MITKQQYVEYLICTIGNNTSSNLAEHLDEVSHDVVTDYLRNEQLTAHAVWELVAKLIQDSPEAFILVDVSVQDKRYSQIIELVKLQYSGENMVWYAALASSIWYIALVTSKISTQLTIVIMHLTKTARPITNIFQKW